MFLQPQTVPPSLEKIASTPVLSSEMPAGFTHVKIVRLPPTARIHTLGGVRIDFSNARESDSASYALMRTNAAAVRLAHIEANFNGHGLFHTKAAVVGRIAVGVTAKTVGQASTLLRLALAHLRRAVG
jgi:hypothetical protein